MDKRHFNVVKFRQDMERAYENNTHRAIDKPRAIGEILKICLKSRNKEFWL